MANSITSYLSRITPRDRVLLIRQLSVMVQSGIPLASALGMLGQQSEKAAIRTGLKLVTQDIEDGHAFSTAAAQAPDIFESVTIAMIKSGEASGQLDKVLSDLALQLEKDMNFRSKVRNALLYPGFVVIVMIIVGIIMTVVVVPRLASVFDETNLNLPWSTQLLIFISQTIINYWYVILALLVALIYGLGSYLRTNAGRLTLYSLEVKIPYIKTLVTYGYLVRFTNVLSMLVKGGVPITQAMQIAGDSLSNKIWADALNDARMDVERGIPLSTALSRSPIFPPSLTQMINVGEQTGKLDSTLDTMAAFYEEQTNNTVKTITTLIEPIVLVIVALAVGFVVVSVILPIYGLADQL